MDPRVERSRRVVLRAALDELAERGLAGVTIESVAARAGVGRSTVYRHWDSKIALVTDAMETLNQQPAQDPADGSPTERVERLLHHLVDVLGDSPLSACLPALIEAAQHDDTVRRFLHGYVTRRRGTLVEAIIAGIASGEFPATTDPEAAALALAGALFYQRLMTGRAPEHALVPALLGTVLAERSTTWGAA